jgi:hypothetical protein
LRRAVIALGVVVVLAIVARLVADPIATRFARKTLDEGEGFRGALDRVHVTFFPPGADITRFKLIEHPGGKWTEPLLYADKVSTQVFWRQLLAGKLVGRVRIEGSKIIMARQHEKKAEKTKSISETLADMAPIKIDRVEIVDGEVLFASGMGKHAPKVWVHDIELVVENMATRKAFMEGEPTLLTASAKVQRSGRLSAFVTMDPWAKGLTFAGEASLKDLAARDLHSFMAATTDLEATEGSIDVFTEFKVKDGRITGGVKPMLKNIEIRSAEEGVFDKLKAWFADTAVEIASDRVPGRNAVATVVPLKGSIDSPDVQLLPAVLGVLRNAFVEGLASGFSHLPPKTAPKKEGLIEQAKEALFEKDEGPPDAQPQAKGEERGQEEGVRGGEAARAAGAKGEAGEGAEARPTRQGRAARPAARGEAERR